MLSVGELIDMLLTLPKSTRVFTAGTDGIHHAELGNLFPLKVLDSKFGMALYIDDGLGFHGEISNDWVPLNEHVESQCREIHH